jgi:BMFP domain-containing protein YqiC
MHFIKTFISIFALQTIATAQLEGQDLVTRNEYQIARGKYLAARDEFLTTRELYLRQGVSLT